MPRRSNSPGWEPVAAGPKKRLDTGVIGVNISIYERKHNIYVAVCVSQSLSCGYRAPAIGHIAASELTQQWLDDRLCEAAAVRWHYGSLRAQGKPDQAVKLEDVAPESIPEKPMRSVDVVDVLSAVIVRMQKSKSQGRRTASQKTANKKA